MTRLYGSRLHLGATASAVLTLVAAAVLAVLGATYRLNQCFGDYGANGVSGRAQINQIRRACYTDVQALWPTRGFYTHRMPYVHVPAGSTNIAAGGLEYPVLTGLAVFVAEQFASTDRTFFLATAALLIPLLLVSTAFLVSLAGRRAVLFALGPPVLLFAVYNWDALALVLGVGGIWAWHGRGSERGRWGGRPLLAGSLLGLGTAAKVYPGIFVLALLVDRLHARDRGSLLRLLSGAVGAWLAVNLPFMLIDFSGWKLTYLFQRSRVPGSYDNSIWWYLHLDVASTIPYLVGFCVFALVLTVWSWRATRDAAHYPWLAMCAVLLIVFVLANKVYSLQYDLWILPFFALLDLPGVLWIAFSLLDVIGFVTFFRHAVPGRCGGVLAEHLLVTSVWGRVAVLALVLAFLIGRIRAMQTASVLPEPSRSGQPSERRGTTAGDPA